MIGLLALRPAVRPLFQGVPGALPGASKMNCKTQKAVSVEATEKVKSKENDFAAL
jgi:hypothetical protein